MLSQPFSVKTKEIFTNQYWVLVLAVISCFLWGSAFPFVKLGYSLFHIQPGDTWGKILFAGYRFFLAGGFLFLVAFLTKQNLRVKKELIIHIVGLGFILTTTQYIFFYIGLSNTGGINAAILNSTSVFFTIILAHLFLDKDKLTKGKVLGVVLGFLGVLVSNHSTELFKLNFSFFGDGFIIISQLITAIGAVYVKKIAGSISIILLMAYQMIAGSLLLILPSALNLGLFPFTVSGNGFLTLIYLFLLSAVAFSIWNTLLKYNPVGKVSVYLFLIPIFGSFLSALLLGERITIFSALALLLVCSGVLAVYGKEALNSLAKLLRSTEN